MLDDLSLRHPIEPQTRRDARTLVGIVLLAVLLPPLLASLILLVTDLVDGSRVPVPAPAAAAP